MNPDPIVLEVLRARDARERNVIGARRAELHKRAVERRKRAKRGGKR